MTVGILAEKPSAARRLAKALGGSQQSGNCVYRGTYQGTDYVLVAARGHLVEFIDPSLMVSADKRQKYKSWNLENLPWDETEMSFAQDSRYDPGDKFGIKGLLKEIQMTLAPCSEIVMATDIDPTGEGNAIFWSIMHQVGLDASGKKFTRMYFTDEAEASFQKAFRDRKDIGVMTDDPEYRKALTRAKFDLLTMQFTRVATKLAGQNVMLRQGRLKSAMVLLCFNQLQAYNAYKKIPFYENRFEDENGVVYKNPDTARFAKKIDVPQDLHVSAVIKDETKRKSTPPPKLLDLSGLSGILSTKGYKTDHVLKIYQGMYESQIVSYPRTEDKTVTPEQFNELLPKIDKIASVIGVDAKKLTRRSPRNTHVKAQGAHGANRPGLNVPTSLDALRRKFKNTNDGNLAVEIYTLLAKNYLSMLAEDFTYDQQKGHIEDFPTYVGTTQVPVDLGFRGIFDADAEKSDDEKSGDEYSVGLGSQAKPFIHEGVPPRPTHPSVKWLMGQLESRDVGTGATRASTYGEVSNARGKNPSLLVEKRGKITMSEAGDMSARLLPNTHIGDLALTEYLMREMKLVAEGLKTEAEVISVVKEWVRDDIEAMRTNAQVMRKDLGLSENVEVERFQGPWTSEEAGGEVVSFKREWSGHRFTDEECEKLLAGEKITFKAMSKLGREFNASGTLERGEYNGHKYVGFQLDTSGPKGIPDSWAQHDFTPSEKQALENGKAVEIDDAISKKTGKPFSVTLKYGVDPEGDSKNPRIYVDHWGTSTFPKEFLTHVFTEDEKKDLEAGKTVFIDGLVGKKGKPFSANVSFNAGKFELDFNK